MNDKVTHLSIVPTANPGATTYIEQVSTFLAENNILGDWSEADVELEPPSSDEYKVGVLTGIERKYYVVGQLLSQIINDEMVEIEAKGTDKIAQIMRDKKLPMHLAAQEFNNHAASGLKPEQQRFLNQCSVTMGNVLTLYEWNVRSRHDEWTKPIIIRTGFVAYTYNG